MWTKEEKEILCNGIKNHVPFQELCQQLGRTPEAVRQYMFKVRLPRRANVVKNNLAKSVLLMCIPDPECFRPNRAFYEAVGMSQKRWWSLYFGEAQITPEEYRALAKYFNVSLQDIFDARQLNLEFKDDGSITHTED